MNPNRTALIVIVLIAVGIAVYVLNQPTGVEDLVAISCEESQSRHDEIPADARQINNGQYWKNSQYVYLRRVDESRMVIGADPLTFTAFPDLDELGKDKEHVYYAGCVLADADPKTFQPLPHGTYGKDNGHVYWRWYPLPNADPETFISLPRDYGKDEHHAYKVYTVIEGADVATFESFDEQRWCNDEDCIYNAQDKNHQYLGDKIVR